MASASITININKNGFDEAIACLESMSGRIDEAARMWVTRATGMLHDEAVSNISVHYRTGESGATSSVQSDAQGLIGYVGSDNKVAGILEYGSPAHYIPPRVVPPGNRHPGTSEYAWLLLAGETTEPAMEGIFEGMIGAALESC